jgi:hypothetical protein
VGDTPQRDHLVDACTVFADVDDEGAGWGGDDLAVSAPAVAGPPRYAVPDLDVCVHALKGTGSVRVGQWLAGNCPGGILGPESRFGEILAGKSENPGMNSAEN